MAKRTASSGLKPNDKVTIEATVTRVSEDGAEVTVRLPLYATPVTLPINAVTPAGSKPQLNEIEDLGEFVKERSPRRRSKLSRALGDD